MDLIANLVSLSRQNRGALAGALGAGALALVLVLVQSVVPQPVAVAAAAGLVALAAALGGLTMAGRDARRRLIATAVRLVEDVGLGKPATLTDLPELDGPPEFRDALHSMSANVQDRLQAMREASQKDNLTGLYNRINFQRRIESTITAATDGFECALLFIDLDGFKAVNDTLGHQTGDRLLQIAAERLRIASQMPSLSGGEAPDTAAGDGPERQSAHIARFGGDEFVLYLAHPECPRSAEKLAARVMRVLSEPFEIGAHSVSVGASIGIALYPKDARTFDDLLRAADTAMYHAKRSGRGRIELYDTFLDAEALRLAEEEQDLREAVIRGDFELYYQPLFDLHARAINGAEALIRWPHPQKGLLLPQQFLSIAERAGLVPDIGEWVIAEAVKRIAEFERTGFPVQISVNVAPCQLERIEFVATVKAALKRWGVTPSLLQIEVTEEAALSDPELAADRLRALSELGVVIAIDDFGTGYSNLASLIMLPVSKLKIDRSLLHDLTIRPQARVLVQTIVTMANSLGFLSVAEGVETEGQLDLLTAMGCDSAQGFLISRPLDLARFRQLLISKQPGVGSKSPLTDAA